MMNVFTVDLYDYFKIRKEEGMKGLLECYVPECMSEVNPKRLLPIMLILPGGGYHMTCSRESEIIAFKYLAQGFACFSLRYSCGPEFKYPVEANEVVLALRYIRENALKYNANKDAIASVGFSAGGHLALLSSSLDNLPMLEYSKEYLKEIKPKGVIACYPVVTPGGHISSFENLCGNDEKMIDALSAENFMNKDSSPTFLFSTRNDEIVDCMNGVKLIETLYKNGIDFSAHIFGRGQHGLSTADHLAYNNDAMPYFTRSAEEWVKLSVEWLREIGVKIKE